MIKHNIYQNFNEKLIFEYIIFPFRSCFFGINFIHICSFFYYSLKNFLYFKIFLLFIFLILFGINLSKVYIIFILFFFVYDNLLHIINNLIFNINIKSIFQLLNSYLYKSRSISELLVARYSGGETLNMLRHIGDHMINHVISCGFIQNVYKRFI